MVSQISENTGNTENMLSPHIRKPQGRRLLFSFVGTLERKLDFPEKIFYNNNNALTVARSTGRGSLTSQKQYIIIITMP